MQSFSEAAHFAVVPFFSVSAVCAHRLVQEIAAHKHHLQDAAQYTLGSLTAVVLVSTCCASPGVYPTLGLLSLCTPGGLAAVVLVCMPRAAAGRACAPPCCRCGFRRGACLARLAACPSHLPTPLLLPMLWSCRALTA